MTFNWQAEALESTLLYRMNAGDEFTLVRTVNTTMTQEANGQSQVTATEKSETFHFRVLLLLPGGSWRMEGMMTGLKSHSEGQGVGKTYDSSRDTAVTSMSSPEVLFLNQAIPFTLAPDGAITDIAFPESITEKFNRLFETEKKNPFFKLAGNDRIINAENFSRKLAVYFPELPGHPVNPGDKWRGRREDANIITMVRTSFEYTLAKVSEGSAEMDVLSEFSNTGDSQDVELEENQEMSMKREIAGTKQGKIFLDPSTGLMLSGEFIISAAGSISMMNPMMPEPVRMPNSYTATEKLARK